MSADGARCCMLAWELVAASQNGRLWHLGLGLRRIYRGREGQGKAQSLGSQTLSEAEWIQVTRK